MTNKELAAKLIDIAKNYKTLYVMGCFGAPMTATNKQRYKKNHSYNTDPERQAMIDAATSDTFGFDCVCLIKGVLWGWCGDKGKTYGGATYKADGVPDIGADSMITKCSDLSTDFSNIEIGEAVWMEGHIGVYVGDGLSVECTPRWSNDVQLTACNCSKSGYNRRNWTKHGKLPYITYETETAEKPVVTVPAPTGGTASQNKATIYKYLTEKVGLNCAAACGVLINLNHESGYMPKNLQNTFEDDLRHTDESYTAAVDSGTYTNFVYDKAGYGLAQWTYWSRKQKLLEYAKKVGKSIGDLMMQLDFFAQEIKTYSAVWTVLKNVPNTEQGAYDAAYKMCYSYEAPANKAVRAAERGDAAKKLFAEYAGNSGGQSTDIPADNAENVHIVKPGETLTKIALEHKTTVATLVKLNGIKNPNMIYVNQKILLPTKEVETAPETVQEHKVVIGDTLTSIARKFGTTYQVLAAYNGIKNPNLIHVGQIIKIPPGTTSANTGANAPQTAKTFAIGDRVLVSGTIYATGKGTGRTLSKDKATMYVCDLVSKTIYPHYIGVSATKGGGRQGWAKPDILTKA